jgi:undecaprenyl-diphosphatase
MVWTPSPSQAKRLARGVVAMVAFLLPVLLLAFAAREQFGPLVRADQDLVRAATDATRSAGAGTAFIVLQDVSQPVWVYIVASLVAAWAFWFKGLRSRAVWAFVTMMVSWNLGLDAKLIVQRARPLIAQPITHAPGYSFPSGHAFNITVIATVMVLLLWPLMSPRVRRFATAIAILVCLAVGLDRVFLGVHFPSDVLAGWILGLGITFSSWLGFIGKTAPPSSPGPSHPA